MVFFDKKLPYWYLGIFNRKIYKVYFFNSFVNGKKGDIFITEFTEWFIKEYTTRLGIDQYHTPKLREVAVSQQIGAGEYGLYVYKNIRVFFKEYNTAEPRRD